MFVHKMCGEELKNYLIDVGNILLFKNLTFRSDEYEPKPFINSGNDCYMIAALQALLSLPIIQHFFM